MRNKANRRGPAGRKDGSRHRPARVGWESPLGPTAPNKANSQAWFNSVQPVVTVPGWDGWYRQRVPKRGAFSGIGILPMLHGLEAHATLVRSTRSGCYLELNQAWRLALFDAPDKSRDQPNRSSIFAQQGGSESDSGTFVAGVKQSQCARPEAGARSDNGVCRPGPNGGLYCASITTAARGAA